MSCRDICIDMDADVDNEFSFVEIRKARKAHTCCECHDCIFPGSYYEVSVGKWEDEIWRVKTCQSCMEIRTALVCGTWYYGQLWEAIEESVYPRFQIECMIEIPSLEARLMLWNRWKAWKAEQSKLAENRNLRENPDKSP